MQETVYIKRLDHLVITTQNMERCAAFYRQLGFICRIVDERMELHCEKFKINVHLQGKELEPHAGMVQPGSADFCLEITIPIQDMINKLLEKNTVIESGPVLRNGFYGTMQSVYIRDPDKNLIELSRYTQ